MSEFDSSQFELTPASLRTRLEDLCVDYLPYTRPSISYKDTAAIVLQAKTGERIIIEKSLQGAQPAGAFFQDLNMSIHPGSNASFDMQQLDYNFNQYADDQLRRRVISGKENGVEIIPDDADGETILRFAQLSLHHAIEFSQNIHLEEEMGVNNQPATYDQIAEAISYLNGATVLDQHYRPVATIV